MKYAKLAAFLDQNEKALIDEWELRVRSELSAAEGTPSLVLRNHLAKLIEDLKGYLHEFSLGAHDTSQVSYLRSAISVFEIHGRERAATPDYAENQLIWEIVLLRRVIMEGLRDAEDVDAELAECLTRFFEELMSAAVATFSASIKETQRRVITSLVHDIRSPLSTIHGSSELLERSQIPEDSKRLLRAMQYGIRRVGAILTEVLDSADIEAGKGLNFTFMKYDVVDELAILKRESEMVYGHRFKCEIDPPADEIMAVLDPAMLVRLLENLISNGFKHGRRDGCVTLRVENRDDELILSVHNWGEPIPKEKQDEIFDYLSTTKGGSAEKKGWGIGLSLAKAIAEGHKGTVRVESTQKKGTTFTLTLPKHARKPGESLTIIL